MIEEFDDVVESTCNWLQSEFDCETEVSKIDDNTVTISLIAEDGEAEICIGSCASPGLHIKWIGNVEIAGKERCLVDVNGVIIEAYGKNIAAWASGFNML